MSRSILLGCLILTFLTLTISDSLSPKNIPHLKASTKDVLKTLKYVSDKSLNKSFKDLLSARSKNQITTTGSKLRDIFLKFLGISRSDLHDKASSIIDRLECIGCKTALSLLKLFYKTGSKNFDRILYIMCRLIPISDKEICVNALALYEPILEAVLKQSPLSTSEMCGILLGNQCHIVNNSKFNWSIPLPPVPKPPVYDILPPKAGSPTIKVLHISDTHFDPDYQEGSLADCETDSVGICCRGEKIKPSSKAAGKWGDYRYCDVPLRTFENALQHINSTHKFDYILWTGDIPPHDVWNYNQNRNINLLNISTELLKKYFPGVPIFPSLGNHESSPVDLYVIPNIQGNWSTQWLYDAAFEAWNQWLPSSAQSTFKLGGFYSVEINPGFRIISLNMNFCDIANFWLLVNDNDPYGQLQWLVDELLTAETKGEKVHIIGHIPPGYSDCAQMWSENYYKIIDRFESTVTAQFFAHTHVDEFEVFYDVETLKRPTNIAYIGPSITTFDFVNPGYRIYTVDGNYKGSSRMVLDHDTYYLNITEANLTDKPIWVHEYSAKSGLNMTSLLPSEWDKLLQAFKADDKLFQKFYRYYNKQSDYMNQLCNSKCKTNLLCRLRSGRSLDPTMCANM